MHMERAAEPRPCFTRPPQELIAPGGTGLPNDREKRAGEGRKNGDADAFERFLYLTHYPLTPFAMDAFKPR